MTYILSKDLPHKESNIYEQRLQEQWRAYERRLQKIKKRLPPSVQEYALADWHYNFSDHRCPHDAWLEYVTIRELTDGESRKIRSLEIEIRLLAACHDEHVEFHDGRIEFIYRDVESYCLDQPYRRGQWDTKE